MQRLVGCCTCRNESGRYLEKVLDRISLICDDIIILDDNSTDNTVEICSNYTDHIYTPVESWNTEWKVRREAIGYALKLKPSYLLVFDADDYFEECFIQESKRLMEQNVLAVWLPYLNMWSDDSYRINCHNIEQPLRLCMMRTDYAASGTWNCVNIHSSGFPRIDPSLITTGYSRIAHLGWSKHEDRIRQYHRYKQRDRDLGYCRPQAEYDSILEKDPILAPFVERTSL